MTISAPWLALSMYGTFPSDVWQTGISVALSAPVAHGATEMQAVADDALNLFGVFWNDSLKTHNGTGCALVGARVKYYVGGVLQAQGESVGTPVPGTGATSDTGHGQETAMCVSLLTASFGRSYRGRMFLPWTSKGVTPSTFQFGSSGIDATATALKAMLDGFNTGYVDDSADGTVSVASQKNGVLTPITTLRIDSIPDTQRGRKNRATADYTKSLALA
uniref:Uncharacterized protein n=1 Tax=uncultured prokaryote TaxID=198431 RepID=A0A0H5Q619_9ZZZZ|nr:hypothetical protein [uncultured prokaryote]